MNMLTRQHRLDVPHASPPPIDAMVVLDFGAKRAGRTVADLQAVGACMITTADHLSRSLLWSRAMWVRVCDSALTEVHGQPWVDDDIAGLVVSHSIVDTAPMATVDDDEDLVRWFVEQHAAAERDARARPVEPDVDAEQNDDVMLTLRNGSRSTRSWRGGGTMRQR